MKKNLFITFSLFIVIFAIMGIINKVNAANVEITFKDENIFNTIKNYYPEGIVSKDTNNLKLVMTEEAIASIRKLDLTGSTKSITWEGEHRIKDLTGLEKLTNLTRLTLDNNMITDLSPLSNLKKLNHLVLNNNSIEDLSPLANLDLEILYVSDNPKLRDVSVVKNFTKLKQFTAAHCNLSQSNLESIGKCTNLVSLFIQGNTDITDISALANCKKLIRLGIGHTSVSSIDPISNITTLQQLRTRKL